MSQSDIKRGTIWIEATGEILSAARLGEQPPDRHPMPIATSSVEHTAPKTDDSDRGTPQHRHTTSLKCLLRLAFSLGAQATAIAEPTTESTELDTNQPHKLKREITTNFLKALTPNQRLINRILDEHQSELQTHHHQMRIEPGHNSSYREKITLATIGQTLQAGDRAPQN